MSLYASVFLWPLNWTRICFRSISSYHRSVFHSSIHPSLSLPALSVSSIMMLIKWTEWIIQIPMAGFLPSALPPAPLCLLEGIIHLALSLYTTLSGRTHTGHATHMTHWYRLEACLHGCKVKLRGGKQRGGLQARFGKSGNEDQTRRWTEWKKESIV